MNVSAIHTSLFIFVDTPYTKEERSMRPTAEHWRTTLSQLPSLRQLAISNASCDHLPRALVLANLFSEAVFGRDILIPALRTLEIHEMMIPSPRYYILSQFEKCSIDHPM